MTVEFPVRFALPLKSIQLALLAIDHVQPDVAVTAVEPLPLPAPTVFDVGEMENAHPVGLVHRERLAGNGEGLRYAQLRGWQPS